MILRVPSFCCDGVFIKSLIKDGPPLSSAVLIVTRYFVRPGIYHSTCLLRPRAGLLEISYFIDSTLGTIKVKSVKYSIASKISHENIFVVHN